MDPITPDVPPEKPDILVVDDTPVNLQLLTVMLKKVGYRVRPVPSGKLAIQAVQKEMPDLILLDINMPDMNGYEVCEQLKANEASKEVPVLFISALDETSDKIRAFTVGGADYITKPFHFEEVEARVKTHLNLRRLQLELARKNRQLRENYDQLKKLEALRDNLTHMIVHDMRSPLMGIMGNLEILEMDIGEKLKNEDREVFGAVRNSGLALVDMVNSLLEVSRLEQGKMPLNRTESDMDVLIRKALDSLGSLTKSVSLLHQKQARPLMVDCDANLVIRVIANLVGNAIKFTPDGGRISICAERLDEGVKLIVADTGCGIPLNCQEKIFDKFAQVEGPQQRSMCSTGLGLTFCKLAVEAHGGRIGVESVDNLGSTFWFTLPRFNGSPAAS